MLIPFIYHVYADNSYLTTFEADYMDDVFVNIKYIAKCFFLLLLFIKKLTTYFFLVP